MEENREYKIYPSNLDIVGAIKQFGEYLSKAGYKPNKKNEGCVLSLQVDPYRRMNAESWVEFIDLLEKYPAALPSFNFGWKKKGNIEIAAAVTVFKSHLLISVRSDDPDRVTGLHETLKTVFKASNPPISDKSISRYNLKKSIFIAHRFDERGNEIASIISKYCMLLGFEVKDGMGYESRVIPDKVTERIQSQDIFIVIFTQGKHDWLISEMAYAKGINKYLIAMADSSLEVSKGIVGNDFEHISFPPENVYKCLIDLLYVLPHWREAL
ncbi:MAG TPA: hypothetical protein VJ624_01135 [Thermodesulfobacteriota bacterium]|nr:hypothetical protein [Thermodesulfobacteriota bacterium]